MPQKEYMKHKNSSVLTISLILKWCVSMHRTHFKVDKRYTQIQKSKYGESSINQKSLSTTDEVSKYNNNVIWQPAGNKHSLTHQILNSPQSPPPRPNILSLDLHEYSPHVSNPTFLSCWKLMCVFLPLYLCRCS